MKANSINKWLLVATLCVPVAAPVLAQKAEGNTTPQKNTAPQKKTTEAVFKIDTAAARVGKGLILKSDCIACHKEEVKLVGPAYKEIAKKYPATETNVQLLGKKIVEGGGGVWGAIPMAPHPALAAEDVRKMLHYILSLK